MTDEDAVLSANECFYRAFDAGDLQALEALWARRTEVACIHPGWPVLRGRDNVIASWRAIFSGPGSPAIASSEATAEVIGDAAYVTCVETLPTGTLVATNIFVREDGAWRLVHHQAGGISQVFEGSDEDPEETVH